MHSTHRQIAIVVGTAAFAALAGACSTDDGKPSSSSSSSGSSAQDSGTSSGDAGGDASIGKKKNAEVGCTTNEECESGVCYVGMMQSFCTIPCNSGNAATVCVAPFTGTCNGKGFCKRD